MRLNKPIDWLLVYNFWPQERLIGEVFDRFSPLLISSIVAEVSDVITEALAG